MTAHQPICIIPARGNSKRFPGKNLAPLAGKPLLAHTIEAAQASGIFDEVYVSSENEDILRVAQEWGAIPLQRDPRLSADTAQIKHVCAAALQELAAAGKTWELLAVLQPTTPLRNASDIKNAYQLFKKNPDANGVMGVAHYPHPPQSALWSPNGYLESYFDTEDQLRKRSQDVPTLYHANGSLTILKADVFMEAVELHVPKLLPYIIPPERAVDIDGPEELAWAESLLLQKTVTPLSPDKIQMREFVTS